MSFITAIGKKIITPAAKRAVKFAHITDPEQRKTVQTFFAGKENLTKLAQELEPDMAEYVQKYFRQYERYGLSQGDLKYIIHNEKDMMEALEILSDKKMVDGILKRKHLLKDGLLGCLSKDNRKAFVQVLNDKTITDEELGYIADLITDENVSIVRKLLRDKNFDNKTLQYLPSTHLTNENVETIKAISKHGNVDLQEKLYLMIYTNKSNSDIAVKLLEKAKEGTDGLDSILQTVYAHKGMSEEGLKAFQLRKNLLTELLDNPNFKLGTDKEGMENYLISKVISSVKPENYEIAKSTLLKRNTDLYQLSDFLKGVTSENQEIAERLFNFVSKDTTLPDIKYLNPETATKYLDEIAKINNPKAQSFYISAMDGISCENIDEVISLIRKTKPENARHAGAIINCLDHTSASIPEIEEMVNAIEKSGREINYFLTSSLVVFSRIKELPVKQFIHRILNNKAISDKELGFLTEKYVRIADKMKSQKDKLEKIPAVLDKLYENKNLSASQIENIFSKIDKKNIDIIEKYANSSKIKELDKLLGKTEVKEIESTLNSELAKCKDEILKARKNLSDKEVGNILHSMGNSESSERIMQLVKNKSIKDEYLSELLNEKVYEMYEKNPRLVLKAMDLNIPLITPSKASFECIPITDIIGEKRFTNIIKGVEQAKVKYNIEPSKELDFGMGYFGVANDLFFTLKQGDHLIYKFDKKTGKLISVYEYGKTIHVKSGTQVYDSVASEVKTENAPATPFRISSITEGKNGKFGTVYTESAIKGQYDIYHTRPDGSRIRIGHAQITPNGAKHIRRTLTSTDGSKTYTAFREDKTGNSYLHSAITDKTGKQISEVTRTFKVVSKNHFVSTVNGKSYDIVFTDKKVVVTKLDSMGKKTAEKVEYAIADIPIDTADKIANELEAKECSEKMILAETRKIFQKHSIQPHTIDRSCVDMLKRLPGDEWFAMSKSCEFVMPQSLNPENAFYAGNSIFMSKELNNNLGVFAHELGHAKFHVLDLRKDKELMKIYNAEKRAYTAKFPESRIESIEYFLARNNAGKRGLNEACAETNLMTDTIQTWEQLQDRTIFLEQYFPNTIAHIRQRYSALS